MTTLVNTTHPYLRILLSDGDYAQFVGGRLEIAEDNEFHDEVMAVATTDPTISIMTNETTCIFCGEVFTGDKAKQKLEEHGKDIHFDLWAKQQEIAAATVAQREIKARAGFVCDVCRPTQTFGSEDDLVAHIRLLHTAAPELDDDGNETGGGHDDDRRPGEVAPPKAATRSTRSGK